MNTKQQCLGKESHSRLDVKGKFTRRTAFTIAVLLISFNNVFSQVGISSTSITPHSSSILELRSTTLGFLPPRMTTTERDAVSSPATGLVIYNTTTNLLNFYNGSSWQISGGSSGVTSVSVTSANGVSGTVANATTTPAITLSLGAITPTSVAATGTVTGSNLSGTNTGDQTITLTGDVTGSGTGSFATAIGAGKVTNTMLAGSISLTTKVTGTLPIANGGTNSTATPTDGGIAYGDGTSIQYTTLGTTGQVLSSNGTSAPTWVDARTIVELGTDVVNNNATANTMADVTGLSFAVTSGTIYRFKATIYYTSASTNTGSRWSVNGPASPTFLSYSSNYTLTATTQTLNNLSAYDLPAASNATSLTNNIAEITGIIKPSANGTVIIRFASEVSGSAITAKAGSTLEWW